MKGLLRAAVLVSSRAAIRTDRIRRRWHLVFGNAVLAIASCAMLLPAANAQGVVWDSAWIDSAPPAFASFNGYYPYPLTTKAAPVTFGSSGDMLLVSPSRLQLEQQILHINAAGSLLWATNFYTGEVGPGTAASSVLDGDGGTFVAFGGAIEEWAGYPSHIARIDGTGTTTWVRTVPARQLILPSANILVATGLQGVTALDAATGNVLWNFNTCSSPQACSVDGAVADADSNVYAIYGTIVGYGVPDVHLVKLDVAGIVAWDVAFAGPASVFSGPATTPLGVVGTKLFLRSGGDIAAFDTADGAPLWTNTFGATDGLMAGASPEPVAISNSGVSRLAADTGLPRWSVPLSNAVDIAMAANGSVILHTSLGLSRIDAESGEVQWTKPLPSTTPALENLHYIAVGASDASHLVAVANASSDAYGGFPPAHIEKVDFATGEVLGEIPLPSVAQGLYGATALAGNGDVFAAAPDAQSGQPQMRVRRIDSSNGSPAWNVVAPLPSAMPNMPGLGFAGMATAGTGIVASAPVGINLASRLWLGMFDAANGNTRWAHEQGEPFQAFTYPSGPLSDPGGNVFASYGMYTFCDMTFLKFCAKQVLTKLSAVDGSELWRYYVFQDTVGGPLPPVNGSQTYAPNFALAGSDVLAIGPFGAPSNASTVVKLSGTDGSVLWSSSVLGAPYGVYDAHTLMDGSVIAVGNGWAKLNGHNGHTVWEIPPVADPRPCPCFTYTSWYLENGDYLRGGENNGAAEIVRLRGDGSGVADFWYPDAGAAQLRSTVQDLQVDAQGQVWLKLQRHVRVGSLLVQFLARFDPESGLFVRQQAIGTVYEDLDRSGRAITAFLGPPVNNRLPVQVREHLHPQPTTTGTALLDTTVSAHGDLAVQISSTGKAYSGMPVTFHITATYTGDAPISGAVLAAQMPWPTGVNNLNCTTSSAQNCVMDARAGNVNATFDISPGGHIDIDGDVNYIDMGPDNATITVAAHGPIGLLEQDTVNNFASAKTVESLFFNGFE